MNINNKVKSKSGNVSIDQSTKNINIDTSANVIFNVDIFANLIDGLFSLSTEKSGLVDFTFVDPSTKKRKINNITETQWNQLKSKYFSYFLFVKNFIEDTKNIAIAEKYDSIATELTEDYLRVGKFDLGLYEHMIMTKEKILSSDRFSKNDSLSQHVMILLFYMFYNCDYGLKEGSL